MGFGPFYGRTFSFGFFMLRSISIRHSQAFMLSLDLRTMTHPFNQATHCENTQSHPPNLVVNCLLSVLVFVVLPISKYQIPLVTSFAALKSTPSFRLSPPNLPHHHLQHLHLPLPLLPLHLLASFRLLPSSV